MTLKPVHGSDAWLDERLTYIGASEAAAALGLSPWDDPISLWERKTGQAGEKESSFVMRLGTLIEPLIGDLYEEATGRKLRRWQGPIRHREYAFIAANPDFRVVGDRRLVQAKLSVFASDWGEPDDGAGEGIPLHYRVQGWAELLATGLDVVDFARLDPRKGIEIFPLARDEATLDDLKADLVEWWMTYVVPGVMPPPSAGSSETLKRRFRSEEPTGEILIASWAQEEELQKLLTLQDQAKALEQEIERQKNVVRAMIGNASAIEGAGRRFSWSSTPVKRRAWKEIAAAYRKLIESATAIAEPAGDGVKLGGWRLTEEQIRQVDAIESIFTTESVEPRLTISKA